VLEEIQPVEQERGDPLRGVHCSQEQHRPAALSISRPMIYGQPLQRFFLHAVYWLLASR
jgi:hypothetical protein